MLRKTIMTKTEVQNSIIPHNHDIICGRGGKANSHIGNLNYRELVERTKPLYLSTQRRYRRFISLSIVKAIASQNPPGRFLRRIDRSKKWISLSEKEAERKTSQALREKREIKQRPRDKPKNIDDGIESTPKQYTARSNEKDAISRSSSCDSQFKVIQLDHKITFPNIEPNSLSYDYDSEVDMNFFDEDVDSFLNKERDHEGNTPKQYTTQSNEKDTMARSSSCDSLFKIIQLDHNITFPNIEPDSFSSDYGSEVNMNFFYKD
jgi:hypothetical protein